MADKVLLVEDDLSMRDLLQTFLMLDGFEVALHPIENDVRQTLAFIQLEKPSIILLDFHLNRFNGLDLLRLIREDKDIKSTAVIIISGEDFRGSWESTGANDFVMKPYLPKELSRKIRKLIASRSDF